LKMLNTDSPRGMRRVRLFLNPFTATSAWDRINRREHHA
jgi:hypothetical protein